MSPGQDVASTIADRAFLDDALARLDPTLRAVVVLHFYLGMPLPEVAAALAIPLGTAKSRLHRALGLLRVAEGVGGASDGVLADGRSV
jgi:RNA polymerase sigma-70 factor (ECF subfamily)